MRKYRLDMLGYAVSAAGIVFAWTLTTKSVAMAVVVLLGTMLPAWELHYQAWCAELDRREAEWLRKMEAISAAIDEIDAMFTLDDPDETKEFPAITIEETMSEWNGRSLN